MGKLQLIALLALALLIGLCVVVGAVLRYHIGGFIRTVAREAREARELEEAPERSAERDNTEDTGA